MAFDDQEDVAPDPHGECRHEIQRLEEKVRELDREIEGLERFRILRLRHNEEMERVVGENANLLADKDAMDYLEKRWQRGIVSGTLHSVFPIPRASKLTLREAIAKHPGTLLEEFCDDCGSPADYHHAGTDHDFRKDK